MKHKFIYSLFLTSSLFLVSCGGGGDGSALTNQTLSIAEKEYVHKLFTTEYLWYDDVSSNVDYQSFTTPQALIDGHKVPQDKWSFTLTSQEYYNMANQKTSGFGFGYTNDFKIYLVRIGSPAYGSLMRADEIIEVNNEAVTPENIAAASSNLNASSIFKIRRDGAIKTVSIIASEYTFKVTQGKILSTTSGSKVGYLRYDSFTETSVAEYEAEFTKFKKENISELIIDLRYNGGGSVAVASILLENISNSNEGETQFYLDWNANYQANNEKYFFEEPEANDLDMKRVVFLVTKNSASASELVISALKPYLGAANVVTIGEATHGKNVGMAGRTYMNNYYFLINFYVKNNNNETTLSTGIPFTCSANDDLERQRGDINEEMLNIAMQFVQNNNIGQTNCPTGTIPL